MEFPAHLAALQLADSAFPSGLYTLSHGLEGYTQAGAIDAATLPDLLADLLHGSAGPADASAFALAHRAAGAGDWDRLAAIDRRLHAVLLIREVRTASIRTGRQLLDVSGHAFGLPELDPLRKMLRDKRIHGMQPVISGAVHAALGVPARAAVAGGLYALAAGFVGAAVRLRVVDHLRAQAVLFGAGPVIAEVTERALTAEIDDIGGFAPMLEVYSARHERSGARLFVT